MLMIIVLRGDLDWLGKEVYVVYNNHHHTHTQPLTLGLDNKINAN